MVFLIVLVTVVVFIVVDLTLRMVLRKRDQAAAAQRAAGSARDRL